MYVKDYWEIRKQSRHKFGEVWFINLLTLSPMGDRIFIDLERVFLTYINYFFRIEKREK